MLKLKISLSMVIFPISPFIDDVTEIVIPVGLSEGYLGFYGILKAFHFLLDSFSSFPTPFP